MWASMSITVAVARPHEGGVTSFGGIANRPVAARNLPAKLSPDGRVQEVCYEAGPCGYHLCRTLVELGHCYWVVAPCRLTLHLPRRCTAGRCP